MELICRKCGGIIADTADEYDSFHGCECPFTQVEETSEETDEEPEECIY
ncbi:MAG: hypothetical protein GF334_03660 [Candidatus Altiarchaeales archaeon]|nr:hypothetical protein [Candidatus Altiarchaeales archaeon]